jgi:hypothetical protein
MMIKEKEWLDACLANRQATASPNVARKALELYDIQVKRTNVYRPYLKLFQYMVRLLIHLLSMCYEFAGEIMSLFSFLPRAHKSQEKMSGYMTSAMLVLSLTYVSLEE